MSRYSAIQRKLTRKVRIQDGGDTIYAEPTPSGRILDRYPSDRPIKLEVWQPRLEAWEVQQGFDNWDVAMKAALREKREAARFPLLGRAMEVLRLRDSKTNDIIMVDVLVASST